MKYSLVLENHQPVRLRDLNTVVKEIVASGGSDTVVFLDNIWWDGIPCPHLTGWYIWSGSHWKAIDGSNDFWGDDIDYQTTQARLLQPGETIIQKFSN